MIKSRGQNIRIKKMFFTTSEFNKSITFKNIRIINKNVFGAFSVLFRFDKKCPF